MIALIAVAAVVVSALGFWRGGVILVCALIPIGFATVAIIRWEMKKSVQAVFETQRMEAEKREMELRLQENQISIMLSQIQPHFLYNTLNSIYQLCETNPMRARSMVNSFAEYLRNNLSTLEEPGLISFETELAHVNTYLDIERVRFEDTLEIEYDIQCVDFSLPVLTVQPIVENAVKHGTSKKEGVSHLYISTAENEDSYEIEIRDTGVGFDASAAVDDGHKHIGITNVRQRLESLCNGTLTIDSTPRVGTVALIKIPKTEVSAK